MVKKASPDYERASGGAENKVSSQEVYNYLIEKHGLSHVHAMGILANIAGESAFIINAIGDNGASYGLFQYNVAGDRRKNMIEYVGEDWETDWKGQVDFIFEEANEDSRMEQYLQGEYDSVDDAAHSFQNNFERPLIKGADVLKDMQEAKELKELRKAYEKNPTEDLKKNYYYNILADSRVLFNCALQDWTSNTVSEADALGCNVLFPAYRSFPEVFANDHTILYLQWSQEDAMAKLELLLSKPSPSMGKISDWTNGTIDRMLDIMTGKGEQWRRDGSHYRTPVSESKY